MMPIQTSIRYKRIAAIYGDLSFQHSRRWLLEQANANGDNQLWTWLYDAQGNGIPADGGELVVPLFRLF